MCNYTGVSPEVKEMHRWLTGEYDFDNYKSIGDNVSIVL